MKPLLILIIGFSLLRSASAQEKGHFDLLPANETIQGNGYVVNILFWDRMKIEIESHKRAGQPLEVRIRTAERQLVDSDRAEPLDQLYRRVLNVSQLEVGDYWLEVQIGKTVIRRLLRIEAHGPVYRSLTLQQ